MAKIAIQKNTSVVKLYYITKDHGNTVIIEQTETKMEIAPKTDAMIGMVNGYTAEIRTDRNTSSMRWQEQGREYSVLGNIPFEELSLFAESLTEGKVQFPTVKEQEAGKPQVEVPVDLATEENDQKSVDTGHSPWKLDPVFVTQVFASLLISPEGIVGDYPIAYDDIKITMNNGSEAVAEIKSKGSIAKYVYLKRLIRQDDTGIWTVIGYDTAIE